MKLAAHILIFAQIQTNPLANFSVGKLMACFQWNWPQLPSNLRNVFRSKLNLLVDELLFIVLLLWISTTLRFISLHYDGEEEWMAANDDLFLSELSCYFVFRLSYQFQRSCDRIRISFVAASLRQSSSSFLRRRVSASTNEKILQSRAGCDVITVMANIVIVSIVNVLSTALVRWQY